MKEYFISSLDDLLTITREVTNEYGSRIWYRGQADCRWDLLPSIQRLDLYKKETFITNDFYIKVRQVIQNAPAKENYAAWMSLMQHYGLPTRLLDWTMSPLIAAFFAVEKYAEHKNVDACIWVLFPRKLNNSEGFGNYVLPSDAYSVQEMLVRAFKEKADIDKKFEDKILACCSIVNDLRMYSQQATFTVHNSERRLAKICKSDMLFKLIIPNEKREYFLESLGYFGITEGFIYPDMEHIAKDIKRSYKVK